MSRQVFIPEVGELITETVLKSNGILFSVCFRIPDKNLLWLRKIMEVRDYVAYPVFTDYCQPGNKIPRIARGTESFVVIWVTTDVEIEAIIKLWNNNPSSSLAQWLQNVEKEEFLKKEEKDRIVCIFKKVYYAA
jgi:hypothetical protein